MDQTIKPAPILVVTEKRVVSHQAATETCFANASVYTVPYGWRIEDPIFTPGDWT